MALGGVTATDSVNIGSGVSPTTGVSLGSGVTLVPSVIVVTNYLLQEDGVSKFTLEDSSGFLLLE